MRKRAFFERISSCFGLGKSVVMEGKAEIAFTTMDKVHEEPLADARGSDQATSVSSRRR